jgi:1-phosphofructokinase family hexose kinase
VLIVCPNVAIDHTIRLATLRPGAVQRTGPAVSVAGGKGANMARAALALGGTPTVVGFLAAAGRAYLRELYAAERIPLTGVEVGGAVRSCTTVIEDDGRVTLLNEPGPRVTDEDWQQLLRPAAVPTGWVIGTGSLPPGAPVDGYARLVAQVHGSGGRCAVDAGGPALRAAAEAGADLVCPNLSEAQSVLSDAAVAVEEVDERGADIPDRAIRAARQLRALGARQAAVTAGARGVALADDTGYRWLPTVPVVARNPIGAGDSFLAGTVLAQERGADWPTAVRFGMATAGSSVENDGAGVVDPAMVRALVSKLLVAHQISRPGLPGDPASRYV